MRQFQFFLDFFLSRDFSFFGDYFVSFPNAFDHEDDVPAVPAAVCTVEAWRAYVVITAIFHKHTPSTTDNRQELRLPKNETDQK